MLRSVPLIFKSKKLAKLTIYSRRYQVKLFSETLAESPAACRGELH
jgi:hypothetical protein